MSMTNSSDRVEIITSVQPRRRWTAPEKVRMVEETFGLGMTVSLVTRPSNMPQGQKNNCGYRRRWAARILTRSDVFVHVHDIEAAGMKISPCSRMQSCHVSAEHPEQGAEFPW